MARDLEQIRKNYAEFDDYKIEHLAKNEISSLDPEIVSIIMGEIKRRGLDSNLNHAIEAQILPLTEKDLNEMKAKISNLSCPECGQRESVLVGTLIREVRSYILLTHYKTSSLISCQGCAKLKIKKARISTALLGWWGIPAGLYRTPYAIIASLNDDKKRDTQSDAILTNFATENLGEIKTNWNNEALLVDFIRRKNSQ